jgi:HlyD family secretion protein
MSSRSIFRQVALERLSTPEQLDQAIRITNPTGWLLLWTVIALVVAAVIWSVIASVPINVPGHGILIQPGGVLNVVASSEGRVVMLLGQPGDAVDEGQVVAHVAQPALQQELAMAEAELAELVDEERTLREFHRRAAAIERAYNSQKRDDLRQSIGFLEERLRLSEERHENERELWDKRVIPQQRLVLTKLEINQVHEELARTSAALKLIDVEENSSAIAREREVLASEMKTSAARRRVANLQETLRRQSTIVSPYTGSVVELKVNPGEIVALGTPLLSLLPETQETAGAVAGEGTPPGHDLVAIVYLSPADGKRVRPGMSAQIIPSTVKREEYGSILGEIEHVARIPSTDEGMMRVLKNEQLVQQFSAGGAPIEIRVRLLRDASAPTGYRWSSSRGPDTEINTGTLVEGEVTVRRVRFIGLVVPGLEPLLASTGAG